MPSLTLHGAALAPCRSLACFDQVLACDGVWDCMTNQEVVDFVQQRIGKMPLVEISESILDHCITEDPKTTGGIGADNMTCVIVQFATKS